MKPLTTMITGNDKFCDKEEFLKSMNEGYANLSEEEREHLKEEAKLWENTLMDGLEDK